MYGVVPNLGWDMVGHGWQDEGFLEDTVDLLLDRRTCTETLCVQPGSTEELKYQPTSQLRRMAFPSQIMWVISRGMLCSSRLVRAVPATVRCATRGRNGANVPSGL